MTSTILGDVVERVPGTAVEMVAHVERSFRIDEQLGCGMTRGETMRMVRNSLPDAPRHRLDAVANMDMDMGAGGGGARLMRDRETAMRQHRNASLAEKSAMEAEFPIVGAQRDPVYDEMARFGPSIGSQAAGIEFDLLLERDLERLSQVRVLYQATWDTRLDDGGAPRENSSIDERMGPVRRQQSVCPVCAGLKDQDPYKKPRVGEAAMCTGHFGHIVLPGACFHPLMTSSVRHMLKAFCWHCGWLPGTDKQNRAAIGKLMRTCKTRTEKLAFLAKRFGPMTKCAQCAQARRCRRCPKPSEPPRLATPVSNASDSGEPEEVQCVECKAFKYFRPLVRSYKQAANETDRLRTRIMARDDYDDIDEDVRRAARGKNYNGFPFDAVLNGNAGRHTEAYQIFAAEVYGQHAEQSVLPLHGERVRAVIAQMSDGFLSLFFNHALEEPGDVRDWFRAMVPRLMPVAPNPVRPTDVGHNSDGALDVRLNDLTKRYDKVLERCEKLSRGLDVSRSATPDNPALFYPSHSLFSSEVNTWFKPSHIIDFRHIELYGELQYFFAAVMDDKVALDFLPTLASAHRIGRTAQARRRNKLEQASSRSSGDQQPGAMVASLAKRLHGKPGRVRGNLMGKRVENAGRSVITPDHLLSIREVRVPIAMASRLYVRERVNAHSVADIVVRAERARTFDVDAKPHPGCTGGCARCEQLFVTDDTELCMWNAAGDQRVMITGRNALKYPVQQHPFVSEIGAVVERPLRTGDWVLMNRQPSLHKHSTQVHRVVVSSAKTLGLNELVTDPYNADFDGDEMNLHVLGDLPAQIEGRELMSVAKQLRSAQNSAPTIGLKQDAATGMYMLTSPDTFLERAQVCNIMMAVFRHNAADMYLSPAMASESFPQLPPPAVQVRRKDGSWRQLWTGAQLANMALPNSGASTLNYKQPRNFQLDPRRLNYPKGGVTNRTELPVLIDNGELLMGRIDKRVAGASAGSITHAILTRAHVTRGQCEEEAVNFIDRCAWLASAFLTDVGFSVGLTDCFPADALTAERTKREVREAADMVVREVDKLLREDRALMRDDKHANRVEVIEERIMAIESHGFNEVSRIVEHAIPQNNAFNIMMRSGGKGKPTNLTSIMGIVGGQQLEGRRVIDEYVGAKHVGAGNNMAAASALMAGSNGEVTSGADGNLGRVAHAVMGKTVSTRKLDNLLGRLSRHTERGQYPGALAGGFIDRSYIDGLTPQQFFFHAKSGREGLVDTACKTADTGDAQRLATKSCEGIVVRHDGTVRSETNQIVTTCYGGTGFDTIEMKRKQLPFIGMNAESLARSVFYRANDIVYNVNYAGTYESMEAVRREQKLLRERLLQLRRISSLRNSECEIVTPGNIDAIVVDVLAMHGAEEKQRASWLTIDDRRVRWDETDPAPYDESVRWLFERPVSADDDDSEHSKSERRVTEADCFALVDERCRRWLERRISNLIVDSEVRLRLCSKQVTRRLRLTRGQLVHILDIYEDALQQAVAPAGESVGIIMVQSMGQPATQMTL